MRRRHVLWLWSRAIWAVELAVPVVSIGLQGFGVSLMAPRACGRLGVIGFLFSFLPGAVWFLIQRLISALGPLRVDGHVSFLRQIPVVTATI